MSGGALSLDAVLALLAQPRGLARALAARLADPALPRDPRLDEAALARLCAAASYVAPELPASADPAEPFAALYRALLGDDALAPLAHAWARELDARGGAVWVAAQEPDPAAPTVLPHAPLEAQNAWFVGHDGARLALHAPKRWALLAHAREAPRWTPGALLAVGSCALFEAPSRELVAAALEGGDEAGPRVLWRRSLPAREVLVAARFAGPDNARLVVATSAHLRVLRASDGHELACTPAADLQGLLALRDGAVLAWTRHALGPVTLDDAALEPAQRCEGAHLAQVRASGDGGTVLALAPARGVFVLRCEASGALRSLGLLALATHAEALAVNADGSVAAVPRHDGRAHGVAVLAPLELRERGFFTPDATPNALALDPRGALVFAAGALWRVDDGRFVAALCAPGGLASEARFRCDGGALIGAGPAGACVWRLERPLDELAPGRPLRRSERASLRVFDDPVAPLVVHEREGATETARVYDVREGRERYPLEGHVAGFWPGHRWALRAPADAPRGEPRALERVELPTGARATLYEGRAVRLLGCRELEGVGPVALARRDDGVFALLDVARNVARWEHSGVAHALWLADPGYLLLRAPQGPSRLVRAHDGAVLRAVSERAWVLLVDEARDLALCVDDALQLVRLGRDAVVHRLADAPAGGSGGAARWCDAGEAVEHATSHRTMWDEYEVSTRRWSVATGALLRTAQHTEPTDEGPTEQRLGGFALRTEYGRSELRREGAGPSSAVLWRTQQGGATLVRTSEGLRLVTAHGPSFLTVRGRGA